MRSMELLGLLVLFFLSQTAFVSILFDKQRKRRSREGQEKGQSRGRKHPSSFEVFSLTALPTFRHILLWQGRSAPSLCMEDAARVSHALAPVFHRGGLLGRSLTDWRSPYIDLITRPHDNDSVSSSGFSTALTSLPLSFLSVNATPRVVPAPQPSRSLQAPAKDFQAKWRKEWQT